MRKLGILMISILISVTAYADGIQYFDHVRSMYEQGRYEEALQGFTACKKLYYDELDIASIDKWINTCNSKIKERNAAVQAKRQAEIAKAKLAEERRAHEEKQKKIARMEVGQCRTIADLQKIAKERGYKQGWVWQMARIKHITK